MNQLICPHCQGINTPADQFCGHCGQPLQATASRKIRGKSNNRRLLLISALLWGLVVAVFIAAGTIWYWEQYTFAAAAAESPPTLNFEAVSTNDITPTTQPKENEDISTSQVESTPKTEAIQLEEPSSELLLSDSEKWQTNFQNLPDGLTPKFSSIIQCRENGGSPKLVDDYLAIWAIQVDKFEEWVTHGKATVTLASDDGTNLADYDIGFGLAADEVGWLIPRENARGNVMRSTNGEVTEFNLNFKETEWGVAQEAISQYSYKVDMLSHNLYGTNDYPQHRLIFRVQNQSDSMMNKVYLFAVVQDSQGNAVDILHPDSTKDLKHNEIEEFTIESVSSSGRCVGAADPQGYVIHYWLEFETSKGQHMTHYYKTSVD